MGNKTSGRKRIVWMLMGLGGLLAASAGAQGAAIAGAVVGDDVWLWNAERLLLTDLGTQTASEVSGHDGGSLSGVRAVLALPASEGQSIVLTGGGVEVQSSTVPTEMVAMTLVGSGTPVPPVHGIVRGDDPASSSGSTVWMWSDDAVYRHQPGTTTATEITAPGGGPLAGTGGIVVSADPGTASQAAAWIWTEFALFRDVAGTTTTIQILDDGGDSLDGLRGLVVAGEPGNDVLCVWSNRLFCDFVSPALAPKEVTTPEGTSFDGIRGLVVTPDSSPSNPSGADIWVQTVYRMFRLLVTLASTIEITDATGGSLPGVRGVVSHPDVTGSGDLGVLLWNDFRVLTLPGGATWGSEVQLPGGGSLGGVEGVITVHDASKAGGITTWLYNPNGIFDYQPGSPSTTEVVGPSGESLEGGRCFISAQSPSASGTSILWLDDDGVWRADPGLLPPVEMVDPESAAIEKAWASLPLPPDPVLPDGGALVLTEDETLVLPFGALTVRIIDPETGALTWPGSQRPSTIVVKTHDPSTAGGGGAAGGGPSPFDVRFVGLQPETLVAPETDGAFDAPAWVLGLMTDLVAPYGTPLLIGSIPLTVLPNPNEIRIVIPTSDPVFIDGFESGDVHQWTFAKTE